MRTQTVIFLVVCLLVVTFSMPPAAAVVTSGVADIVVTNNEAGGQVGLLGFTWDTQSQIWRRSWDSTQEPTMNVSVDITVSNFIDPEEEMHWKAFVEIQLFHWQPNLHYAENWTNDDWPSYDEWDENSEAIEETLFFIETQPPAAFAGWTWDFIITIDTWWIGDEPGSSSHNITGYIEVF